MGVTGFSFILLPLCLLWMTSPDKLLKLIPLFAVFEAAAALTVGDFGIQPGLVPALIFCGFMVLQLLLGANYRGQQQVIKVVFPFVVVAVWGLVGSVVLPWLLEGRVYVWPQKAAPPYAVALLSPDQSNVNQDVYLIVECVFVIVAAIYLRTRQSLLPFLNFFLYSGFVVAAVALWQFASKLSGIPFPDEFFFSNPGWSILTEQTMGFLPRLNAPFSEPSSLAGFFCSIVGATGWMMLQKHSNKVIRSLFAIGLLIIFLSTSTTGIGVLVIFGTGVPIYALVTGSSRMISMTLKIGIPMICLLGLLFFAGTSLIEGFQTQVETVYESVVNKQDSASYEARSSADMDSLAVLPDSFGLGAGWGSNRSSSLLPGLLAGLGVPGCLALMWFAARVVKQVRKARRMPHISPDQLMVIDGSCGALIGFMMAAVLSGPSITSMTFFFLLALLIATSTQVVGAVGRVRPMAQEPLRLGAPRPQQLV